MSVENRDRLFHDYQDERRRARVRRMRRRRILDAIYNTVMGISFIVNMLILLIILSVGLLVIFGWLEKVVAALLR